RGDETGQYRQHHHRQGDDEQLQQQGAHVAEQLPGLVQQARVRAQGGAHPVGRAPCEQGAADHQRDHRGPEDRGRAQLLRAGDIAFLGGLLESSAGWLFGLFLAVFVLGHVPAPPPATGRCPGLPASPVPDAAQRAGMVMPASKAVSKSAWMGWTISAASTDSRNRPVSTATGRPSCTGCSEGAALASTPNARLVASMATISGRARPRAPRSTAENSSTGTASAWAALAQSAPMGRAW